MFEYDLDCNDETIITAVCDECGDEAEYSYDGRHYCEWCLDEKYLEIYENQYGDINTKEQADDFHEQFNSFAHECWERMVDEFKEEQENI